MAQELTFNISEDRRKLQGPVEAKNFNLKFGTDDVAITNGNPKQWVQGRIGDNELKQVFVNITEGENNTPKDVAGLFLAFVGIIHDKDGRPHRVVDYKHSTTIDVEHGRFRFDFPDQAFTVAGEYQQAFFMLVKEGPGGGCVATMEFDMQVMANFVFTDLVPEDYITPFNDTVDQLLAACKKFKDDTAADEAKFKQELEDAYAKFQKDTNTQLNNFKDATDEDLANFKKANADDIAKFKQQYADAVKAKQAELQNKVDSYTDKLDTLLKDLNQQGIDTTTLLTTLQANIKALDDKIKLDGLFTKDEAEKFEQEVNNGLNELKKNVSTYLIPQGLNVKNFGAVGDGTTDDTGAFRSAIEAARSQVNHHIYIPEGTYLVTDELVLPDDIGLIGYGAERETVIKTSGVANLFELGRRNVLSNLTLDGTSNGKDITLLKLGNDGRSVSDALVTDVFLDGTPDNKVTGIRSAVYNGQTIFNCTFKNITARRVYDGLKFSAAENTWINGNSVTNFTVIGFAHAGIYFTSIDNGSLEIAQNHFVNVQIEAIPDAEGKYFDSSNAAAVWLEWGDRNRFDMLHVWNDDSGKVTKSIRLTPGPNTYNLNNYRDNVFNGFAETTFYTNAYTARFNDLTGMQIESKAPFGYAQYNADLRKFKLDDVRNLISDDLIANAVIGHPVPLFVSTGGTLYASYDSYGPFLSLKPSSGELFVPLQGNDSGYISGMSKFTIGFDISFDTAEDPNKVKLTAGFANFNTDAQRMDVEPAKRNIAIDQLGYSYRITSTINSPDVSAYNVHALNLKWDGVGEGHVRVRRIFIVPGEIDATHDIKLGRAATRWNVKADSQKLSTFRDIGIFTLPDAFVANQMQFSKSRLTGQVDNGTFYGTYPFWY